MCVCVCVCVVLCVALTAHGSAGIDLLSGQELLEFPDVHSCFCHEIWISASRTGALRAVVT